MTEILIPNNIAQGVVANIESAGIGVMSYRQWRSARNITKIIKELQPEVVVVPRWTKFDNTAFSDGAKPEAVGSLNGSLSRFDIEAACLAGIALFQVSGTKKRSSREQPQLQLMDSMAAYVDNGDSIDAINLPNMALPLVRPGTSRILHICSREPWEPRQPWGAVLRKMVIDELELAVTAQYSVSLPVKPVDYVVFDIHGSDGYEVAQALEAAPVTIRARAIVGESA